MAAHFRFVRDHHRHIKRIALVTDIALAEVAERLAAHFVSAEIKRFPAGELDAAKRWITSRREAWRRPRAGRDRALRVPTSSSATWRASRPEPAPEVGPGGRRESRRLARPDRDARRRSFQGMN
jgi:hypothetical protein